MDQKTTDALNRLAAAAENISRTLTDIDEQQRKTRQAIEQIQNDLRKQ